MKRILYIIALLCPFGAMAQDEMTSNFYHLNGAMVNPAAAAKNDGMDMFLGYRDQWTGLKGAPETRTIGVNATLAPASAVGFYYNGFSNGMLRRHNFMGTYAHSLKLTDEHIITLGASAGMYKRFVSRTTDLGEETNDPAVLSNDFDQTYFKSAFGVCYTWKSLRVDAAIPELYDMGIKKFGSAYFAQAAYKIAVGDSMWAFTPSVAYRYKYISLSQADFALKTAFKQIVWLQIGYRTNAGIVGGLGLNIKSVHIGYSYEFTQTPMSRVATGSNEFTLIYTIPFKVSKEGNLCKGDY